MAITAGIGSDHVDLQAAMDHNIDVMEVTYCNSVSCRTYCDDDIIISKRLSYTAQDCK